MRQSKFFWRGQSFAEPSSISAPVCVPRSAGLGQAGRFLGYEQLATFFSIWQELSVFVSDVPPLPKRLAGFGRVFEPDTSFDLAVRGSRCQSLARAVSCATLCRSRTSSAAFSGVNDWQLSFRFGRNCQSLSVTSRLCQSGWQDLAGFSKRPQLRFGTRWQSVTVFGKGEAPPTRLAVGGTRWHSVAHICQCRLTA
jgi:hypothetical protein